MGMYDSIIIDHLTCPYCQQMIFHIDFQTKDGNCVLASYHLGDIFPLSCVSPNSKITWLRGLASCPKCHTFNKKTMESIYTWLDASFAVDNKTHRIIHFELWRFMRDLNKTERQHKDYKLKNKSKTFNPSKRK